jgi:hypothetical protein
MTFFAAAQGMDVLEKSGSKNDLRFFMLEQVAAAYTIKPILILHLFVLSFSDPILLYVSWFYVYATMRILIPLDYDNNRKVSIQGTI